MRRTGRLAVTICAVTSLVVLGGCGGPSASDYQDDLDTLCAAQVKFNAGLPQLQKDRGLSTEQLQPLIEKRGAKYLADIKALEPPEELATAHRELVKALQHWQDDPPTTAVDGRTYLTSMLTNYQANGARGCAASTERGLKLFTGDQSPSAAPSS